MNTERIRAFLGVWMPMALGLLIVAVAVNFYLNADLARGVLVKDLEPWRFTCASGAFFIGGVLLLSTYGRYTKARAARSPPVPMSDERHL